MRAPRRDWFGLRHAHLLDGLGGGSAIGWDALDGTREIGLHWVHLDIRHPNALRWLRENSGLDSLTLDALTAARVSPRAGIRGQRLLLILQGIDFSRGALPADTVPVRLWTDGHRIITCGSERLQAVEELRVALVRGGGPVDASDLIARLADLLVGHMDDVIAAQLDATHRIGHAGGKHTETLVAELAELRRAMIRMRHTLAPQRRALALVSAGRLEWLRDDTRRQLRENANECLQYLEGLDAAQQITEITQDEILQRSSEQTERRVYSLTVITAIFLPLSFITGLLGVNLAGIPEANDPLAFALLCLALLTIIVAQLWFLRRKGWL